MIYITFTLYLYLVSFSNSYELQNVGTVLFTDADITRKCWTNEQLALIHARFIYQDVLPKPCVLTMDNDLFVASLINYFRMALHKVNTLTTGKTRHINLLALSDTIGGYFHHTINPLCKQAFYSGYVTYDGVQHVMDFYEEIKEYLKTDGKSWNAPSKVHPLKIKREPDSSDHLKKKTGTLPCSNLLYNCSGNGMVSFDLPFLDSKTNPNAIAIPFKEHPLHSLTSKDSEYVLLKYYTEVTCCMKSLHANETAVRKFKRDFKKFLEIQVIPHLNDESLFPAFGSVYCIHYSLVNGKSPPKIPQVENPSKQTSTHHGTNGTATSTTANEETDYYNDEESSSTIIFVCLALVILIWLLSGLIYCFCRMRRKNKNTTPRPSQQNPAPPKSTKSNKSDSRRSAAPATRSVRPSRGHPPDDVLLQNVYKRPAEAHTPAEKKGKKQVQMRTDGMSSDPKLEECGTCNRFSGTDAVYMLPGMSDESSQRRSRQKISTSAGTSQEKRIVFGYDFETSTSDSSSEDESSSSTSPNTPRKN